MTFAEKLKLIPSEIVDRIEQDRLDGLTHIHQKLAECDGVHLNVVDSSNTTRRLHVKFNGVDGSWYLVKYDIASDGNYTISRKYKESPRIYVTKNSIETNWQFLDYLKDCHELAHANNGMVNSGAYLKLEHEASLISLSNLYNIAGIFN